MRKIFNLLKTLLITIVLFGVAMVSVILVSGVLVYFFEMRWTISFNISSFATAILILVFGLVGKLAKTKDSLNISTKKQSFVQRTAKAVSSFFF